MSAIQTPTNANANSKPALHGVKIKTRKSQQKAQAKYEPIVFRDSILKTLSEAQPGNFELISQKLDAAGNTLDFKKYGETLFEILLTGGILAPGGTIIDDGAKRSPFSIFSADDNLESIKKHVEVFDKLIRQRYKYLQRSFEETISNLLRYINKWKPEENYRLATAIGLFASAYLGEQSIEHLGGSLKKAGIDNKLLEFFPPNKRDEEYFARYFEAEDMKQLVEYHSQKQRNFLKEQTIDHVKEMLENESSSQEIVVYLKQRIKEGNWQESDFVQIVWDALMQAVDWSARPDMIENQASRQIKKNAEILAAFASNPKSEVALLQKIQIYCHEDTRLMRHFRLIVKILYEKDVVSENAIFYWYEKGAKPSGKGLFLKQMESFVNWLRTVESDSEDDDDENEE
ncbi:ARM repeat-containing protein [Rhizophagus clarus]|uniref:ARM repeat-containing protein n=1 Tax=Rhizophagus clarus TaxID=94130 RepID=A0A8H3KY82_9GLOM|nr:ARM repeat-containing protein [Rhizophagus clarus]